MKTEMVMPQMGESITEGTILKWHKTVGDAVKQDEVILEVSTDKVDTEIPSPTSGVIVELRAKEGETVPVKTVIAIIDSEAKAVATASQAKTPTPEPKVAAPVAQSNATLSKERVAPPPPPPKIAPAPAVKKIQLMGAELSTESSPVYSAQVVAHAATPGEFSPSAIPAQVGERFYSPLVRSLASQHGLTPVDLGQIPGTGTNGRVTKADVMNYLKYRPRSNGSSASTSASKPVNAKAAVAPSPEPVVRPEYGADGIRVEPMDKMRRLIAEHMVRSKSTSPHVYSTAEVDVTNIAKWRAEKQNEFIAKVGFKLSFTPFFLEAAINALLQFPYVNASVDGESIVLKRDVNLGCAVALGNTGLIVPVIKNADKLSFVGIAEALNDIAQRARTKKLKPDETQGGTFTVTNPGVFGNIIGCPIINQPQLAILSIGAIKKRPMVINDAIAIRDMVYLTLTYDHRVIDGSLGGQFLQYIAKYVENWDPSRPVS